MAFIRSRFAVVVLLFCFYTVKAQTVYYPVQASQLLKATAEDMAMLLQRSIAGSQFNTQAYNNMPSSGIVFVYDSTIKDNQACSVISTSATTIRFTAAEDNGLCFGVYQYLQLKGFRFYQPGSIWEITPVLSSVFEKIDTVFTTPYKYKTWSISGGHNRWAMDNSSAYNWEAYDGENGHNWALYQRRNGMLGAYRFNGHRGDLMSGTYLSTLQNNPCFVANYNGSRVAGNRSVPDINNNAAIQLWGNTIAQKFTQYRNTVLSNTTLYANLYRNFSYYNGLLSVEVPDGAQWGNVKDNSCNGNGYPKEADQHMLLSNKAAQAVKVIHPGKRFQAYAYSSHANTASTGITADPLLDIQVIATAFQSESSPKGLLKRWYMATPNVSEYHYLNIPQWGGETPVFHLQELTAALDRIKNNKGQGLVIEASPAKFASLPLLLAANQQLLDGTPVEVTLRDFCDKMFGNAAAAVYQLLSYWSDDRTINVSSFMNDNKYKLPLYFKLLHNAVQDAAGEPLIVQQRLRELKAYLHYMTLYYEWAFDQRSNDEKAVLAGGICTYLARINRLQIVNSYFLIANMVSKYPAGSSFQSMYNVTSGTAYKGGALSLITAEEIDADFTADLASQLSLISDYRFETARQISQRFTQHDMASPPTISVSLGYTNGAYYTNRSEFFIEASKPGKIDIAYNPIFEMVGKGYINFTVEADEEAMSIIKDISIENPAGAGHFTVELPAAGRYRFSVVSRFKSALDLKITTHGNLFYKKGAFLGSKTENYRNDLKSLPGYFYVPKGLKRVIFSVNNARSNAVFATPEAISKSFMFVDNKGKSVQPHRLGTDQALFYLEIPAGGDGNFWQATKMEQYNLCFSNISNLQWYAVSLSCKEAAFTAEVIRKNGNCFTRLKAKATSAANLQWSVTDGGQVYEYNNLIEIDLPGTVTPNAIVTLKNGTDCRQTKKLSADAQYLQALGSCAAGGPLPTVLTTGLEATASLRPQVYPNPSTGIYYCQQNGQEKMADQVSILNGAGELVASFVSARQFDISRLAAGVYWYRMNIGRERYTGRLVKL